MTDERRVNPDRIEPTPDRLDREMADNLAKELSDAGLLEQTIDVVPGRFAEYAPRDAVRREGDGLLGPSLDGDLVYAAQRACVPWVTVTVHPAEDVRT